MSYVGNKPAQTTIPVDDSVTTAMVQDDAVTADKVANAINTSIAANTSKVTNATHTGDVTGATALTIAATAVETGMIEDDAVTADKLADSINTAIAANTAKVTNATHTGDVTGATALTIATDAVDIAMLSATGTASSSTFLRGDNAWSEAGGGKVGQVQFGSHVGGATVTTAAYADSGLNVTITPTATDSKILLCLCGSDMSMAAGRGLKHKFYKNVAGAGDVAIDATYVEYRGFEIGPYSKVYMDEPATTSELEYSLYCIAFADTVYMFRTTNAAYHFIAVEILA